MDIVVRIIDKYPTVSKEWLMTGKGDMLLSKPPTNKPHYKSADDKPKNLYQQAIAAIKKTYDFLAYPTSKDLKEMAEAVESIENLKEYYESREGEYQKEIAELKKRLEKK